MPTLEQLKAQAYDLLVARDNINIQLDRVNAEIRRMAAEQAAQSPAEVGPPRDQV